MHPATCVSLEQIDVARSMTRQYGDVHALSRNFIFLQENADVNAQAGFHGGALRTASAGGHTAVVRQLLEKNADMNAQGGEYGSSRRRRLAAMTQLCGCS